jgi:hypothetical protein
MKAMLSPLRDERGQSIALFVLVATTLMGFVALAIDGGMAYAIRRQSQNAADAAAITGTYRLVTQRRTNTMEQQAALRTQINLVAQEHGVRDTDGNPSNHINDNIMVFYTDDQGQVLGSGCQVTQCSNAVARQAHGISVRVARSFNTFFAGIVGWRQMSTGGEAVGVMTEGPPTSGLWAIFARDEMGCGGFVADATGSSVQIYGNAHSNASFKMSGSNTYVTNAITFRDQCHHCVSGSGAIHQVPAIRNLSLPSFDAFRNLAYTQTGGTSTGPGRYNGNLSLGNGQSNSTIGSAAHPFTYINGDFNIGSNASNITLHGLVFVTGDVKIQGNNTNGSFVLVAGGEIELVGATNFSGVPYANPNYPILQNNGVRLFSNLDRRFANGNVCSTAVIKIAGSSNFINGSVIAPTGRIEISGSSNEINGALIGDSVSSSGSSNIVRYNHLYFPPQPDRIELLK